MPGRDRHMSLSLCLLWTLTLLFANACSLSLFPGYHPQPDTRTVAPVSWFQPDSGHLLFNTKIDLMKKHFSGLMVVQPDSGSAYRVVFLTEVGLKIFDLEFLPDRQVKVHYVLEAINRKTLIHTLSGDISLVLMNGLSLTEPEILGHKDGRDVIFRYRNGKERNYYYVSESTDKPYQARQTGCVTNKVRAEFYGKPATGLDSIKIKHDNLRLSIELYRIIEIEYVAE
jgi:hypothetical protein